MVNGGFEEGSGGKDLPKAWQISGVAERVKGKEGNWKIKLSGKDSGRNASAAQTLFIPKNTSFVTLGLLAKGNEIHSIKKDERGDAAVSINFIDQRGRPIGKPSELLRWTGTFPWSPCSILVRIPERAEKLEFRLELREAVGDVMFDEVELLWGLPDDYDRTNLVVDGGFEYYNPFSLWFNEEQKIRYPGFKSRATLSANLTHLGESISSQELVIGNADRIQKAEFELYLALDKVKALQTGGGARAEIQFWDNQENSIETKVFGPWTGSESWTRFASPLTIPPKSERATLSLIVENASGKVSFDDVRLTAYSAEGPMLRRVESRTDTAHWKKFKAVDGPLRGPLDNSYLLNTPAGNHGFIKVGEEGHFYFEDGTRARFFGVNLQPPQALPTHKEAEELAERLAQLGYNLVRITQLDAPFSRPNIFDPKSNDTQHLSKKSLDLFDYLIAQLKARGIYVYLDLLVNRVFKAGDDVPGYLKLPRGAKGAALFNRRIIELQKQYARDLFTHFNPYTKTKLSDEPAVVMTEIVNENSLCRFYKLKLLLKLPSVYIKELQSLWVKYLKDQGISNAEDRQKEYLNVGSPVVQRFYADIQKNYFREMATYLKSLGVKIPIAGTNFPIEGWDLETNASLDFIDRHGYWDRPEGGYEGIVKFHNGLITKEVYPRNLAAFPERINPIVKLSRLRVKNKPLVVGEWNFDWPNEYRAAGPLLMAAYASFQDWDAIIQFNYEGNFKPKSLTDGDFFDVSTKPELFMQLASTARLFLRKDVKPAEARESFPIFMREPVPASRTLMHGIDRIAGDKPEAPTENESPLSIVTDTGELKWEVEKGIVTIDTARHQAAIGLGGTPVELKDVTFSVASPFASVSVASADDQPIKISKHLLLIALARSENTGTVYNATHTALRSSGASPILLEPVLGSVSLSLGERTHPKVYALDAAGNRLNEIKTETEGGLLKIPLGEAEIYEILF